MCFVGSMYLFVMCLFPVFPTDMPAAGGQRYWAAYGFLCDASRLCFDSCHVQTKEESYC